MGNLGDVLNRLQRLEALFENHEATFSVMKQELIQISATALQLGEGEPLDDKITLNTRKSQSNRTVTVIDVDSPPSIQSRWTTKSAKNTQFSEYEVSIDEAARTRAHSIDSAPPIIITTQNSEPIETPVTNLQDCQTTTTTTSSLNVDDDIPIRLAQPPAIAANLVTRDANSVQRAAVLAKARAKAAIEAAAVKAAQSTKQRSRSELATAETGSIDGNLDSARSPSYLTPFKKPDGGSQNNSVNRLPSIKSSSESEEGKSECEADDDKSWIPLKKSRRRSVWWGPFYKNFMASSAVDPQDPFAQAEKTSTVKLLGYDLPSNSMADLRVQTATIHPNSKFLKTWNTMTVLLSTTFFLLLPVTLGFLEWQPVLQTLTGIILPFWILGVVIDMKTGVKLDDGMVVMDSDSAMRLYLRKWVALDIVLRFPYVFFLDRAQMDTVSLIKLRLVCLLNIFAFFRTLLFHDNWFTELNRLLRVRYSMNSNILRTIRLVGLMMVYWHWSSCIRSWIEIITHMDISESMIDRYTRGVYNSASEMLSAGFGADPPITTVDRWCRVCNMIASAVFLALLVGNVTTVMTGMDSSGRMFREKIDEVQQYILYKDLDSSLKQRVIQYFEYKYSKGKFFDETAILAELNGPLKKSIYLHNCKALILKVPFFTDANDSFLASVVTALKINHFLAGDMVIEEGTTGDEMYFIATGTVEVITGKAVRAKLTPGLFFGEIAVLFGRLKRTASIKTSTPCILYSLSKGDLDEVLLHHPVMADRLRVVASERLMQLKALKIAERESNKLKHALTKVGGLSGPTLPNEQPSPGQRRNSGSTQPPPNEEVITAASMVAKELQRLSNTNVPSSGYAGGPMNYLGRYASSRATTSGGSTSSYYEPPIKSLDELIDEEMMDDSGSFMQSVQATSAVKTPVIPRGFDSGGVGDSQLAVPNKATSGDTRPSSSPGKMG